METKKIKRPLQGATVQKKNLGKAEGTESHGCGGHSHDHDQAGFNQKPVCKLFENEAFQEICGETMHPGGLELTEKGIALCGFKKGAKILDVGCGKGETAFFLNKEHGFDLVGIDQSEILVEQAKKAYPKLNFQMGDADYLEFPSSTFDGVLMECVLSLCDMKEEVLHECWCVLKQGGKLILSDLYLREPSKSKAMKKEESPIEVKTCMTGALIKEELLTLLEETGFIDIEWMDCSETILSFTANAIMKYGSLEKFWDEMLPEGVNKNLFCDSVCSGKPGYFLLVATKKKE